MSFAPLLLIRKSDGEGAAVNEIETLEYKQ